MSEPTLEEKMKAAWAYAGWDAAMTEAAKVRDDLDAWVAEARAAKDYATGDRLRPLADRLNQAISYPRPELARGFVKTA